VIWADFDPMICSGWNISTRRARITLTPAEATTIPLTEEPATWPNLGVIVDRLVSCYSERLDIRIPAFAPLSRG
jgi:hypothetical protein